MLRTNTKKVAENVKIYIIQNFEPYNEEELEEFESFEDYALYIYKTFYNEEIKYNKNYRGNLYDHFKWWCQGLPSVLDCCYYYNRSAKDDVASILEEDEEEKNRYTEAEAEELLTRLIFKTIVNSL